MDDTDQGVQTTGTPLDYLPPEYRPKVADPAKWEKTGTPLDYLPPEYRPQLPGSDNPEARKMAVARTRAAIAEPETVSEKLGRLSVPFVSQYGRGEGHVAYGEARKNVAAGQAHEADYQTVADYEEQQQREAERNKTLGGKLETAAYHLPAVAGEFAAGGAALRGLGLAAKGAVAVPKLLSMEGLKSVGMGAALGAAHLPFVPSAYVDHWMQGNLKNGRDAMDLRGLPPAVASGALQLAVLGGVFKAAGQVPGAGLTQYAKSIGYGAAVGTTGANLANAAEAVVDQVLPKAYQMDTGYGPLGDMAKGQWGEAGQHLFVQLATFAAFAALHGPRAAEPRPQQTQPGPQPPGPKAPGAQSDIPPPVFDAAAEYMNHAARSGMSKDAAMGELGRIVEHYTDAKNKNPDMTRDEARDLFSNVSGKLQAFGHALAEAMHPEGTAPETPPPETPPEPPKTAQRPRPEPQDAEWAPKEPEAAARPQIGAPQPSAEEVQGAQDEMIDIGTLPRTEPLTPEQKAAWEQYKPLPMGEAQQRTAKVREIASRVFPDTTQSPSEPNTTVSRQGEKTLYLEHDPARNVVRVDFDKATAGVSGEVQEGSKDFLDNLKKVIEHFRDEGIGVEYRAAPRKTGLKSRQDLYAKWMEKAGFEETPASGKNGIFSWKPKAAEPPAPAPQESAQDMYDRLREQEPAGLSRGAALAEVRKQYPDWSPEEKVPWQEQELDFARLAKAEKADKAKEQRETKERLSETEKQVRAWEKAKAEQAAREAAGMKRYEGGWSVEKEKGPGLGDFFNNPSGAWNITRTWEWLKGLFRGADREGASVEQEANRNTLFHLTNTRGEMAKVGAKFGDDLLNSPALRHMALNDPSGFDTLVDNLEMSLKSAAQFNRHDVIGDQISEHLQQLRDLKQAVSEFKNRPPVAVAIPSPRKARGMLEKQPEPEGPPTPEHLAAAKELQAFVGKYNQHLTDAANDVSQSPEEFRAGFLAHAEKTAKLNGLNPQAFLDRISHNPVLQHRLMESYRNEVSQRGTQQPPAVRPETGTPLPGGNANAPAGNAEQNAGAPAPENAKTGPAAGNAEEAANGIVRPRLDDETPMHSGIPIPKDALKHVWDNIQEFSGKMGPRMTAVDRESGEKLARFNSAPGYAVMLAPQMAKKTIPEGLSADKQKLLGDTLQEWRQRYIKKAYTDAATQARSAGNIDEADALQKVADDVTSLIGHAEHPLLKDFATYRATLASPEFQQLKANWIAPGGMKDFIESQTMRAQGLDDPNDIRSFTQIPGFPMHSKAMGKGGAPGTERQGNLTNTEIRRYPWANQAKGNAADYDTDLKSMIEHSITRAELSATKAELFRTMEKNGVGQWGPRGTSGLGHMVPNVFPPRGTQTAAPGETAFYIPDDGAFSEVMRALKTDQKQDFPVIKEINGLFTRINLIGFGEAVSHAFNLGTAYWHPGMAFSPFHYINYISKILSGDQATMDRLVGLAQIGAMKTAGGLEVFGGKHGLLWGGPTDPTSIASRALNVMQQVMRLAADDAFNYLKKQGRATDTETNRRDFINQLLGQYNVDAQQYLVRFLRNSGFGPFAVATSNFAMAGLRSATGTPAVEAPTMAGEAKNRMAFLFKAIVAGMGAAALYNFLRWGKVRPEDTELADVVLGEKDGKKQVYNLLDLTGARRGFRTMGAKAIMQGLLEGKTAGAIGDKMRQDVTHAALGVAEGPLIHFGHTALTGENALGIKVSRQLTPREKKQGGAQWMEDLKAAALNMNPIVGVGFGADRPDKPLDNARWLRMFQKLAPQERGPNSKAENRERRKLGYR